VAHDQPPQGLCSWEYSKRKEKKKKNKDGGGRKNILGTPYTAVTRVHPKATHISKETHQQPKIGTEVRFLPDAGPGKNG